MGDGGVRWKGDVLLMMVDVLLAMGDILSFKTGRIISCTMSHILACMTSDILVCTTVSIQFNTIGLLLVHMRRGMEYG
jgi:hypothetical protein